MFFYCVAVARLLYGPKPYAPKPYGLKPYAPKPYGPNPYAPETSVCPSLSSYLPNKGKGEGKGKEQPVCQLVVTRPVNIRILDIIILGNYLFNLHATKLFIVTSATKGGVYQTPLDLVLGSNYCIV